MDQIILRKHNKKYFAHWELPGGGGGGFMGEGPDACVSGIIQTSEEGKAQGIVVLKTYLHPYERMNGYQIVPREDLELIAFALNEESKSVRYELGPSL